LTLCFLILFASCAFAQSLEANVTDTTQVAEKPALREHSVKKATIMSAVLPGLGQVYNRKWWKVPIVYAGLGTCIYFIDDNTSNYTYFRDQLIAELDSDPSTLNETEFNSTQLRQITDQYRRWLDLSYISLGLVYALNIIDAHVDAHLFRFDVSEDLTLHWQPQLIPGPRASAGVGLVLNF
jgi:hypothetical protein